MSQGTCILGAGHLQTGGSQRSGVFWGLLKFHLWSMISCPIIMKIPLTRGRLLELTWFNTLILEMERLKPRKGRSLPKFRVTEIMIPNYLFFLLSMGFL